VGIERISRKTDLIPPEKLKRILLESTKVRILNESRTLACPKCFEYSKIVRIKDIPENLTCPSCGKGQLGLTIETPDFIDKIHRKHGRNLSQRERKIIEGLKATSLLLRKHGRVAACVLAGRRIGPGEAKVVLRKAHKVSDKLFESIMVAERGVLRRRFW
jgi:ATP-dependent Lhr-like helicase